MDIEGVSFVNDEATTPANPYLVRTKRVYIGDNKLTLAMGIFDEYTMLNYLDIEAAYVPPSTVTDLRVTAAITDTSTLTATLRWTPLSSAVTTTLRYFNSPITDLNWNSAITLTSNVISNSYTAVVPYSNNVTYFALKSQDTSGAWSGLSNNAFWPYYTDLPAGDQALIDSRPSIARPCSRVRQANEESPGGSLAWRFNSILRAGINCAFSSAN